MQTYIQTLYNYNTHIFVGILTIPYRVNTQTYIYIHPRAVGHPYIMIQTNIGKACY